MSPIIAQLLVTLIQALIQAIQAKLEHEERLVVVVDPAHFTTEEGAAALARVCAHALLLRRVGEHEAPTELAPEGAEPASG